MWAKSKIQKYMSALAVVTPFADFTLSYDSDKEQAIHTEVRETIRSNSAPAKAITPPNIGESVDRAEAVANFNQNKTITRFLNFEFQYISPNLAKKLVAELLLTQNEGEGNNK